MTDRELMQRALEALELLARYENPATKIQVRKPRDGGPIVTMYPHKVATEAAAPLRERLAQPEQEPVALPEKMYEFVPTPEPVKWHHPECEGECIACLIERVVQQAYGSQGLAYLQRHLVSQPQPEQEPYGYFQFDLRLDAWVQNRDSNKGVAFYTTPPQRKPLTDEEIERACVPLGAAMLSFSEVARAIEAAHGIKE